MNLLDNFYTDLNMPDMAGLQLTKEVMERFPRPILIVSAAVHPEHAQNIFKLLEAGAIDVLPKPRGGLAADEQRVAEELIRILKIISGVVALTRRRRMMSSRTLLQTDPSSPPSPARSYIVAIGASTGGPQALQTILARLPADFPAPVLCVQHISDGFLGGNQLVGGFLRYAGENRPAWGATSPRNGLFPARRDAPRERQGRAIGRLPE